MNMNPSESADAFYNSRQLRYFTESLIKSMNEGHIKITCDPGYPFQPVSLLHMADRIERDEQELLKSKSELDEERARHRSWEAKKNDEILDARRAYDEINRDYLSVEHDLEEKKKEIAELRELLPAT